MSKQKFQIGDKVSITKTGQIGTVKNIVNYSRFNNKPRKGYMLDDDDTIYLSYELELCPVGNSSKVENTKASNNGQSCTFDLSLEKAREWYKAGGDLRMLALKVFTEKEINSFRPTSWEEYCKNYHGVRYWLDSFSEIEETRWEMSSDEDKNTLPTKELAEAFLAMMQLMSLRQAWIGDWEPNWKNKLTPCIVWVNEHNLEVKLVISPRPLTFPTIEMAVEFMKCFFDLLIKAKYLY